jgi:hypothetical protein
MSKIDPGRIKTAKKLKIDRNFTLYGNLNTSWTGYKSWRKGRKIELRFSKTGEPNIEKSYATHFVKKSGVA